MTSSSQVSNDDKFMQMTILCYGDSNTWGYVPQDFTEEIYTIRRFPRFKRWTGLLQKWLGDNYYIIEEGLNGRTTNIDYHIPPDRNGKNYLKPCLYTHAPIDLVVLALGGNDLKVYFKRSAEEIKEGLSELISIIQSSIYGNDLNRAPEILITSPIIPFEKAENFYDENGIAVLKGAVDKAKRLVELYFILSKEKNCHFLDISSHVLPSDIDGIHLNEESHEIFAKLIAEKINYIYSKQNFNLDKF